VVVVVVEVVVGVMMMKMMMGPLKAKQNLLVICLE
jgi:hypothetical protein